MRKKLRRFTINIDYDMVLDEFFDYVHDELNDKETYKLLCDIIDTGMCDEAAVTAKLFKRYNADK